MLAKIISGGQTGVDRAVLDVALELAVPCGGWCPWGRTAEDGPLPTRYPLTETSSAALAERTEHNVRDADGTLVLYRRPVAGGTQLTIELAARYHKPCLVLDVADAVDLSAIRQWLHTQSIRILNVAGPRESEAPGIYDVSRSLLRQLLALPGVLAS